MQRTCGLGELRAVGLMGQLQTLAGKHVHLLHHLLHLVQQLDALVEQTHELEIRTKATNEIEPRGESTDSAFTEATEFLNQ